MLTKNNGISGGSVVVSPSSILAGFDDVLRSTPTGTACSTFPNNNNLDIMDVHQVGGTSNGDSILTFSPLNDVELRRRTRNNAILAKIQELEANASLQAARSERLRMMKVSESQKDKVLKKGSAIKFSYHVLWQNIKKLHNS